MDITPSAATDSITVAIMGTPGSGRATLAATLSPLVPHMHFVVADLPHLPQADALLLVASAAQGVDGSAAAAWEHAAEQSLPRLMAMTHLDVGRVDDDEMRLIAERVLGEELLPLTLPLADDDEELAGTLTLTTMVIRDEHAGLVRDADAEHREIAGAARERLVEAVLANTANETLVSSALLGIEPSPERLDAELMSLARQGVLALALPVVATPIDGRPAVGLNELAATITRVLTDPAS